MNKDILKKLVEELKSNQMSENEFIDKISKTGYAELGFAKIDHDRSSRKGFPEVVYAKGKTSEQILEISLNLLKTTKLALVTRLDKVKYKTIEDKLPEHEYNELSKTMRLGASPIKKKAALIPVLTAGTADIPVAEEACVTLETMGFTVKRIYDVGAAGIHRFFGEIENLNDSKVIIVVAGMDGVLPTVVGGLVRQLVIAVPTSTGYGTALGGFSALLTMLNSCAPGLVTVNIDNGFGAAFAAALVNGL